MWDAPTDATSMHAHDLALWLLAEGSTWLSSVSSKRSLSLPSRHRRQSAAVVLGFDGRKVFRFNNRHCR